jgi:carotenoid cleavage dioxygenase-like enzyme
VPHPCPQIQGQLPEGLRGTLLRNGPGLFEVGGRPVPQPFDGDGMVASLSFDGQVGGSGGGVEWPMLLSQS